MTTTAEPTTLRSGAVLSEQELRLLDQFSQLLYDKIDALAQGPERTRLVALAKQAVHDAQQSLARQGGTGSGPQRLPVSKLKVSEVLAQRWVDLSQASFYRAVDQGRFYCTTPTGRSIGKEFPAWQFVQPVPELIAPVLQLLEGKPSSEIHLFWISAADELNELSPAEVMAGKPFETRGALHSSQQALLQLPSLERARKVTALAKWSRQETVEHAG